MNRTGLLLALLLAAGCATGPEQAAASGGHHASHAAPAPDGPSGSPASEGSASHGGFNGTDAAWVQLMIPMIDRTMPMLDLAAHEAADPAVRRLAASLGPAHRAERARLAELRKSAGISEVNVHEGHDMPGMVTASQLDAMRAAGGKELDELFLRCLRDHLDQSVLVTRGERASGSDPRALALAADLERARTAQLARLDELT
ncbi:DUF305 domain-containing protein [Nonomuraea sp. LPB2021202275-12-8]|uniref:DUF305 domain-containing protein n=1 Tax=Nonomuraea sp. LPB2021202275-12-8 TaxID=3120159 RepID=UPI00300DAD31